MKYSVFVIFSALLLLELSDALPARFKRKIDNSHIQRIDNDKSGIKLYQTKELDERSKLLIETVAHLSVLAKYTVEHGVPLFEKTLDELTLLPEEKRSGLEPIIIRMSEFVEKSENFKITGGIQNILQLFLRMLDFGLILREVEDYPTEEPAITLKNALDKNGLEEYKEGFVKQLNEFYIEFNKLLNEHLPKFSEKDKKRLPDIIEWMTEFKAETDPMKKYEKFQRFYLMLL